MGKIKKKWSRWVSLTLAVVLLLGTLVGASPVYASGVEAAGVSLTGQNTAEGSTLIQFDISWDYSWRDEVNWDAVWVFAKYQLADSELWHHAHLATDGHTVPAGAVVDVPSDGMGAFIYRAENGGGTVDYDGVGLKWLYGNDGLADDAVVVVKVFAVEMVYIPSGEFYLGDNADDNQLNAFKDGGTGDAYLVTSGGAMAVGQLEGEFYYDRGNVYTGDQQGPIPAEFPNGYDAFYIMKYEGSQRQYCEFLNTLTPAEQLNRNPLTLDLEEVDFHRYRYYMEQQDGVFGCDANSNDILNEADDGEWVAAPFIGFVDGCAFADWAGLRPYTELEYEKVCRGDQPVVNNEYAWGNAEITDVVLGGQELIDGQMASEAGPNVGNGACNHDSDATEAPGGPMRGGFAATATSDRLTSGASYYGVMEMSGNLWELTVSVGNPVGRSFTGSHGDGILYDGEGFEGNATNIDWPGYVEGEGLSGLADIVGSNNRGGCFIPVLNQSETFLHTAGRGFGAYAHPGRTPMFGYRLARTAE